VADAICLLSSLRRVPMVAQTAVANVRPFKLTILARVVAAMYSS
jgi:hypothetical protein